MPEDLNPSFAKATEDKERKNAEELEKELEECRKKVKEYLAGWQRARADFLNYKKEEMERMEEFIKFANFELILKILPILDNFEKAEKEIPEDKKKDKFLEGLLQIKTQLKDFLKSQGVEEIKAMGEKFDPNFHEAVEPASAEARACKEVDTIIEVAQKGYKLQGKVIRPAKVKVAK